MNDKESIQQEINQELSEREDLIAQLNDQDRIMRIMKEELEKCKREKDDYIQVVFQLQRQGKFLNEGMFFMILPRFGLFDKRQLRKI